MVARSRDDEIIVKLFSDASKHLGDYVYALLRVKGIEHHDVDPILNLYEKISAGTATSQDIDGSSELWSLLVNLCRLQRGVHYMPFPFNPDEKNFKQKALEIHVSGPFGERLKELAAKELNDEVVFLKRFIEYYYDALKEFSNINGKLFKMSNRNFELFQIIADENGLYGFKVYFPNDSHASFERTSTGTRGTNVIPENTIGFMVGMIDENKPAWRVDGRWLYEVGISGRYNNPGEWKPLTYPGKADLIQKEASDASEDERIQAIVFYMLATGHKAIEFAVKTQIKLPDKETTLPGGINLLNVEQKVQGNTFVYDGWMYLKTASVEDIKMAIEQIQRTMEGLAFSFDKEVKWQLKYNLHEHRRGAATPSKKDMDFLNTIVTNSTNEKDLAIEAAINWYNLGHLTQNPLNAFLCFHISIEGLAAKLAKGELDASEVFGLSKENKSARRERIKKVFDDYYSTYFSVGNIEEMIKQAYFVGVVPIKNYLQKALESVFSGQGRTEVLEAYFKKGEGIWDLRGSLVHEVYSDWHPEEYEKVQKKLPELQEISKAFITRVALQISPEQKRPDWSKLHAFTVNTTDPRSVLIVSPDLRMIPNTDWKIRAEWLD